MKLDRLGSRPTAGSGKMQGSEDELFSCVTLSSSHAVLEA